MKKIDFETLKSKLDAQSEAYTKKWDRYREEHARDQDCAEWDPNHGCTRYCPDCDVLHGENAVRFMDAMNNPVPNERLTAAMKVEYPKSQFHFPGETVLEGILTDEGMVGCGSEPHIGSQSLLDVLLPLKGKHVKITIENKETSEKKCRHTKK